MSRSFPYETTTPFASRGLALPDAGSVQFTPTGPPGTLVTGNLFVDDFNDDTGGGDELATIPYTYTVG